MHVRENICLKNLLLGRFHIVQFGLRLKQWSTFVSSPGGLSACPVSAIATSSCSAWTPKAYMVLKSIYFQGDIASKVCMTVVCYYMHFRAVFFGMGIYIIAHQSPVLGQSGSQSSNNFLLLRFHLYDVGPGMEGSHTILHWCIGQVQKNRVLKDKALVCFCQWCWGIHALNDNTTSCLIFQQCCDDPDLGIISTGYSEVWVIYNRGLGSGIFKTIQFTSQKASP